MSEPDLRCFRYHGAIHCSAEAWEVLKANIPVPAGKELAALTTYDGLNVYVRTAEELDQLDDLERSLRSHPRR